MSRRARASLTMSLSASCTECLWAHHIDTEPPIAKKVESSFNVTVNTHAMRHQHDVRLDIVRVYPGKRAKQT